MNKEEIIKIYSSISIVVSNVWTSSIFSSPTCVVVGHTEAKTKERRIWTTVDICIILVAIASSARCIVKDEPGRADISLGSSLLCETEQKDQQEEAIHDVIFMTHQATHKQSNTLTSNVQNYDNITALTIFTVSYFYSLMLC